MTGTVVPLAPQGVATLYLAVLASVRDKDGEVVPWQDRALCAQTDPEAFFPEKGGSTREAKRVCRACEVRAECLEYALGSDERSGIWGGLSPQERRSPASRALALSRLEAPRLCRKRLHVLPSGTGKCGACTSDAAARRYQSRYQGLAA